MRQSQALSSRRSADGSTAAVSVVIPTHYRPEALKVAVASVLSQDYAGPLECIVVFDQPHVDEIPGVAHPTWAVRSIRNSRTPGLAGSRNTGVLAARGSLVAFLDDDDAWLPDKLGRQVSQLDENPAAIASVTGMVVRMGDRRLQRLPAADELTVRRLARGRPRTPSGSFVIRRHALLEAGLVDEELPGSYGEDLDLLLRLCRLGRVLCIREPLVSVDGSTSVFRDKYATQAEALRYILAKHPDVSGDPYGYSHNLSQIALLEAASGRRIEARRDAALAVRARPWNVFAYAALAASVRLISAERILARKRYLGFPRLDSVLRARRPPTRPLSSLAFRRRK
jgi:GT2 family glycosyltransferase